MTHTERYKNAIIAALKVQQLRKEIKQELKVIGENLTGYECQKKEFDNKSSSESFCLIQYLRIDEEKIIEIKENDYVGSTMIYKDVEISLHQKINELGSKAMKQVFEEINLEKLA